MQMSDKKNMSTDLLNSSSDKENTFLEDKDAYKKAQQKASRCEAFKNCAVEPTKKAKK